MTLHVHLLRDYGPDLLATLRQQLAPGVTVTAGEQIPQPARYHVLVGGRPTREQLVASPNLQAVVVPWAGIPRSTRELLTEFPDISVHNLHHNAAPTAELAVALLLAAAKFVVPYDQTLRHHDWTMRYERPGPSVRLAGKTALVLGYGAIGRRVARTCRGLEMTVLTIKRTPTQAADDVAHEIHPPEALHALLPRADALLICLPHTPETDGLIGAAELALLPARSLLVNIGRGPIVDEQALYAALRDGMLYAAGLDVWYNYPADEAARSHTPPSQYPFHELDNVVMSPHRGGDTAENDVLRLEHLARLLNAAARSEPMPNRIDLARGY